MSDALFFDEMTISNQLCPISMRTAYFGARRIAPVAATTRIEARGARPAVDALRPARRHNRLAQPSPRLDRIIPAGTFVAQVISQFDAGETNDARAVARLYDAAEALGSENPCLAVAAL